MSARFPLLILVLLFVLAGVYLSSPAASTAEPWHMPGGIRHLESAAAPAQDPAPSLPCDPTVSRVVDPLVLAVNEVLDVAVGFDYQCASKNQAYDYFLLVENSSYLRPEGWSGRRLIGNVRDGLHDFVLRMDYDVGSRGGLILFSSNELANVELQGDSGGQQALINGIRNINETSSRSSRASGEAVELAMERLRAAQTPTGTKQLILLLDAGAPMTQAKVDVFEACQAAKDEGILMSVYALEAAEDRLSECASEGLFRGSSRESGDDIPEDMQKLGEALAAGKQVDRLLLSDRTSPAFAYVDGSGKPAEPVRFIHELSWDIVPELLTPEPDGGYMFEYQLRAGESYANEIVPLSEVASLTLYYKDGYFADLPLDNPEVCIYAPGREEFCDSFKATLTPPAPTETPTGTPTATEEGPQETETPTVTPTEEVVRFEIYLPVSSKEAEL